ncbi:MAG: UDP-N-acetylmuramoyl-tripeptide--D-alanyl-D-alanine ligase [Longimicrobiaceae bacterium]
MSGFRWSDREVRRGLGLEPAPDSEDVVYAGVSTDSRKIGPGDLFVALVGERFDAHDFLAAAAGMGATGAVVAGEPEPWPEGLRRYLVEDTLLALGRLAQHRRRALGAAVVGVAGSNGKTTTKDLLRAALGEGMRAHATEDNLNNRVGVPLTLLAAPQEARVVVVEVGTNQPGEVAMLADIVEPDLGVVTSIGEEHLEKLGNLEGVLEEELCLLPAVRGKGRVFLADEPPELAVRATRLVGPERVRTAGVSEGADLRPEGEVRIEPDGSTRWHWRGAEVRLPLPGRHNVRNALLALGVAEELGVPALEAAGGIATTPRLKLRGEWLRVGGIRVLADCYNANPPSVIAALDLLASLPVEGDKVAVLGTMLELGENAEPLHRSVAERATAWLGKGIDRLVATGLFADAFQGLGDERVVRERDPVAAYRAAASGFQGDETVLLKASRGERLERWIDLLKGDG